MVAPDGRLACWYNLAPCRRSSFHHCGIGFTCIITSLESQANSVHPIEQSIRRILREAARAFVVAAAAALLLAGVFVGRRHQLQYSEVQRAKPHLSVHLQLHREGYSSGSEARARVGSGAADRSASDGARSSDQGSSRNASDAGTRVWQSHHVRRDSESRVEQS